MKHGWTFCLAGALALTACAEANTSPDAEVGDDTIDAAVGGDPDAAVGTPDAAVGTPDAPPTVDAAPPIDAPPPVDAAPPDAFVGCSDGVITGPELCDDGNLDNGDGCSATCAIESFFRCQGTPSVCTRISILYAPSEADDPTYRAAIAAITGGVVDYTDGITTTPSATILNAYDCVYTWANQPYLDPIAYGDNLADYVDGGGNVVLGVFATFTTGNSMAGRIMTPGYNPVVSPLGTNRFVTSNYIGDGTTFIHDSVTLYECQYRDILALQGTGVQDGSYADGEIAHAHRPDFKVIYSNGSGASALGCTGDWARAVANSCAIGHTLTATP